MDWKRLFSAWIEKNIGYKSCWLGNCSLENDFGRMNVSWKFHARKLFLPELTPDMKKLGRNQVWVVYEFVRNFIARDHRQRDVHEKKRIHSYFWRLKVKMQGAIKKVSFPLVLFFTSSHYFIS